MYYFHNKFKIEDLRLKICGTACGGIVFINFKFSIFILKLVLNPHQTQSLGRGDWSGGRTGFSFENFFNYIRLPTAAADFNKRADNISYHIIQKAVSFNFNIYPFVILSAITAKDCSYRTAAFIAGCCE
jgi:hypothetical protein